MTDALLILLCAELGLIGGLVAWHLHYHGRLLRGIGGLLRSQCNDLQGTHNMAAKCRQHLADLLQIAMGIGAQKGK